jgi:hypothetical protein
MPAPAIPRKSEPAGRPPARPPGRCRREGRAGHSRHARPSGRPPRGPRGAAPRRPPTLDAPAFRAPPRRGRAPGIEPQGAPEPLPLAGARGARPASPAPRRPWRHWRPPQPHPPPASPPPPPPATRPPRRGAPSAGTGPARGPFPSLHTSICNRRSPWGPRPTHLMKIPVPPSSPTPHAPSCSSARRPAPAHVRGGAPARGQGASRPCPAQRALSPSSFRQGNARGPDPGRAPLVGTETHTPCPHSTTPRPHGPGAPDAHAQCV